MWWKAYFWIMLILSVVGIVWLYGELNIWTVADWIEIVSTVIALVGLYAYIYQKTILTAKFWKVFFWLVILNWTLAIIHAFTPLKEILILPDWLSSRFTTNGVDMLVGIVLSLPMVYAAYKLGYSKIKKK